MTANRIIVGYDRSIDATSALTWALDEAVRTGTMVEILYAYEWPIWMPAASMVPGTAVWPDAETDQAIKDSLNEAAATASKTHPTVPTALSIVRTNAAMALIDRSAEARLIVLGSRGHSAVTNLLGSVSVAVSAHARCPVVIVRGAARVHAPVVVGVDESAQGEAALAFAAEQAAARDVPLRLIRAWKPVTGLWEGTAMEARKVTAEERRTFDQLVAAWHEKYPELRISAEAVVDHPARSLEIASHTAQLLVVGSRGRGSVRGMLLGSVSQHLLRHATCSVAVVHQTA